MYSFRLYKGVFSICIDHYIQCSVLGNALKLKLLQFKLYFATINILYVFCLWNQFYLFNGFNVRTMHVCLILKIMLLNLMGSAGATQPHLTDQVGKFFTSK